MCVSVTITYDYSAMIPCLLWMITYHTMTCKTTMCEMLTRVMINYYVHDSFGMVIIEELLHDGN